MNNVETAVEEVEESAELSDRDVLVAVAAEAIRGEKFNAVDVLQMLQALGRQDVVDDATQLLEIEKLESVAPGPDADPAIEDPDPDPDDDEPDPVV